MASIRTAIELSDNFSGPMMDIIRSANAGVSAMDSIQSAMSSGIDTTPFNNIQAEIDRTIQAADSLDTALRNIDSPVISPSVSSANIESGETIRVRAVVSEVSVPENIQIPAEAIVTQVNFAESQQMNISDISARAETSAIDSGNVQDYTYEIMQAEESLAALRDMQSSIAQRSREISVIPESVTAQIDAAEQGIESLGDSISVLYQNPLDWNADEMQQEITKVNNSILEITDSQSQLNSALQEMENAQPPPELDTGNVQQYQNEIDQAVVLLQKVMEIQGSIDEQSRQINVVPDDIQSKVSSVNESIQQMEAALNHIRENPFDLDSETVRLQITELNNSIKDTLNSQSQLNEAMQELSIDVSQGVDIPVNPVVPDPLVDSSEPVEIPVIWNTDTLDVFTGTGIERFQQEVQSANNMLKTLNSTQQKITAAAASTDLFPASAVADITKMQSRLQTVQQRIQAIEKNRINIGTDAANAGLEQLRSQLEQAVREQQLLNSAIEQMDVSGANKAYLQLSDTIGSTERYIRDNTTEQGQFNREIQEGTNYASDLSGTISKAVTAFAALFSVRKVFSFMTDSMDLFDTQLNAETQLMSVLANMLNDDYVSDYMVEAQIEADTSDAIAEINAIQSDTDDIVITVEARTEALQAEFDAISAKASEIQSKGIYGDEAMIAGAAELSTYFTDPKAITLMMDTLSDYAMGMSGGGEIDASAMTEYATNLGKIMSGSYEAMTKKGFEFTEAQKAIIEGTATEEQIAAALGEEYLDMSADMQASAAITQVIDESWAGLYETMSNTPEGQIIQLKNSFGDLQEKIGGQLYPVVSEFLNLFTDNWDMIESFAAGFTAVLSGIIEVLTSLIGYAMQFADYISNNWVAIAPKIKPVAVAVGLIAGAFLAYNVAAGIAAAAQWLFNTSLFGCPLVWIIVVLAAVVAAIFYVVNAINNLTGSSVSAIGVITGALATAGAFVWDLFLGILELVLGVISRLVNPIIAFVNFFGNVFNDPIASIIHLFGDLADNVLGVLQKIASALDYVFGSNMADTVQGWRDSLSDMVDTAAKEYGNGQYEEIMSALDLSVDDLGLERIEYSDAWEAGYNFGENLDKKISEFSVSDLFSDTYVPSAEDYATELTNGANGIGSDIADTASNTDSIADSMDITEEDLKYLRDIAEQETINRFTTAEIHIEQINNNNISSDMDLDGVVDGLTSVVNEAVDIIAEGVHT